MSAYKLKFASNYIMSPTNDALSCFVLLNVKNKYACNSNSFKAVIYIVMKKPF